MSTRRPHPLRGLANASPFAVALMVVGLTVTGGLAAAGMGVLPMSHSQNVSTGTKSQSTSLSVAGGSAQSLDATEPSPNTSSSVPVAPPAAAPVVPAAATSHGAARAAATPTPPKTTASPKAAATDGAPSLAEVRADMARAASPSQFPGLEFGCAGDLALAANQPGTMPCGVISQGFSGQIRTECDPGGSPYMNLPIIGVVPPDTSYYTCSAPIITLAAGGWAIIPLTVQPTALAPTYDSGTALFLTLWAGTTMINPDPYDLSVTTPTVPANFSLACQAVTETAYSETITVSGFAPTVMPWGTKLLGTCTLAAHDAANAIATNVSLTKIDSAAEPSFMAWSPVMALTEADALNGPPPASNGAIVTPTGGTVTVWFAIAIPPPAIGSGPTPITFTATHVDGGGAVQTTITVSF